MGFRPFEIRLLLQWIDFSPQNLTRLQSHSFGAKVNPRTVRVKGNPIAARQFQHVFLLFFY